MNAPSQVISRILKHESKRNTYKIALVRAINDVALEYPHLPASADGMAVPLRLLAEFWLAYYWAFVYPHHPIRQGHDSTDVAFRAELTQFRQAWQTMCGQDSPAEGFYVKSVMSLKRKRESYPEPIRQLYEACLNKAMKSLQQPIKYAGTGEYTLFQKPRRRQDLPQGVAAVSGTQGHELCLWIPAPLWRTFQELSLWIEALCLHEWCLFTETVRQPSEGIDRGKVYSLLTARPDNRRPLTWERNQIDLLLMEGCEFLCPWTHKRIRAGAAYDLDHIVPVALRPINELWNLIPADPMFNSQVKRDRLPSEDSLQRAEPSLLQTYQHYWRSQALRPVLESDARRRFGAFTSQESFELQLVKRTAAFVRCVTQWRHAAQF
jgi:hypothetical protein